MAIIAKQAIAVGTTAVALTHIYRSDPRDGKAGSSALLKNTGSVTVYVGDSSVSSTTGYTLAAGDSFSVDLQDEEVLYGVTASGSSTVDRLQVNL